MKCDDRFLDAKERVTACCSAAIRRKYGEDVPSAVKERLRDEYRKIGASNSWDYMLLLHRIASICDANACRRTVWGCAGGSLVAYLLDVTDCDPVTFSDCGIDMFCEFFLGFDGDKTPDAEFCIPDGRIKELLPIISAQVDDGGVALVSWPAESDSVVYRQGREVGRYTAGQFDGVPELVKINIHGSVMLDRLEKAEKLTGFPADSIDVFSIDVSAAFSQELARGLIPDDFLAEEMPQIRRPADFYDLVQMNGLAYGTGAWCGNAKEALKLGGTYRDVTAFRDDVMQKLIDCGISRKDAYELSEYIYRGKAHFEGFTAKQTELLKCHCVPDDLVRSWEKIQYLFPRAHAVEHVTVCLKLLWYKTHFPEIYCEVF